MSTASSQDSVGAEGRKLSRAEGTLWEGTGSKTGRKSEKEISNSNIHAFHYIILIYMTYRFLNAHDIIV